MKKLIGLILLSMWGISQPAQAQKFLEDYQRFRSKHRPHKTWARRAQRAELELLKILFATHQQQTGRRLDVADTLHLLTLTPVEVGQGYAPRAGMIWNGSDTIAFRLEYAGMPPYGRTAIKYEPFLAPAPSYDPYADVSLDSLVALVSRRQFAQAQHLAADYPVFDGSSSQVVSAVRTPKGYQITAFTLPAFGFIRGEKPRK
ncbi:hypothetical protein [Hymenobacter edaphi]|uniref:Uncharacterized protein n=1 Tax=Hymenobacter edaphi TaxID=2211146 RepID=A0A328BFZ5_9BACT|nr:hypothetical protein [Hymenobacter edaphi]RAK65807.1 hypothetical protein DLM85_13900 [Hymenobacter edaphi]